MKALFERAAVPLASSGTKGAWLAQRRSMPIDATSFDVADTPAILPDGLEAESGGVSETARRRAGRVR